MEQAFGKNELCFVRDLFHEEMQRRGYEVWGDLSDGHIRMEATKKRYRKVNLNGSRESIEMYTPRKFSFMMVNPETNLEERYRNMLMAFDEYDIPIAEEKIGWKDF